MINYFSYFKKLYPQAKISFKTFKESILEGNYNISKDIDLYSVMKTYHSTIHHLQKVIKLTKGDKIRFEHIRQICEPLSIATNDFKVIGAINEKNGKYSFDLYFHENGYFDEHIGLIKIPISKKDVDKLDLIEQTDSKKWMPLICEESLIYMFRKQFDNFYFNF